MSNSFFSDIATWMSVKNLLVIVTLACALPSFSQGGNFTFSPTDLYEGVANAEMYTEHTVYIYPNSAAVVNITWRVIGNTCPAGWDFQMCDWQHCYDGFPNSEEMDPVPAGGSGYLKLLVNPFNIGGSGAVHFWVYPTDSIELRQDVVFQFNATTGISHEDASNIEIIRLADQRLFIDNATNGDYMIYDIAGRVVERDYCNQQQMQIDLSALPAGTYIAMTPRGTRFKFLKP
jgi:hypothetical protein